MVRTSEVSQRCAASGKSRDCDITTRTGKWPPPCLAVNRGLSFRTVFPPTITASLRPLSSKTRRLDNLLLIHEACPLVVAILPSRVMAYLRIEYGILEAALIIKGPFTRRQDL
uniref:Uncharacterized protein n=1 Tax=Opuntia streptacantha TaxID=393608 RepID=A0A7C9A711_OPUST